MNYIAGRTVEKEQVNEIFLRYREMMEKPSTSMQIIHEERRAILN